MDLKIQHTQFIYITIFLYCSIIGIKANSNEDSSKNIKWEIFKSNDIKELNESIEWEIINENKYRDNKENTKKKKRKTSKEINSNHILLQLGKSVPTANTLSLGELKLETSHVSTFNGGMSGGIGNQNYSGLIQYGLNKDITFGVFYTEGDDQLYKKISKLEFQPENLWAIYGGSIKWKILSQEDIKLSIDTSIERWRLGSGGCFGYNCDHTSNNIFNLKNNQIVKDNIIGSISTPITWDFNNKLDITLAPRYINLPKTQENGKFYGENYGIALGANYKIGSKLDMFLSSYIPISGNNYMNKNLQYFSKNIYTFGINHKLDEKVNLEGYLTNSFGQTSATSILTIPSSNEIMYGGRFTYIPTWKKGRKTKSSSINNKYIRGKILNITDSIFSGYKKLDINLNKQGLTNIKTSLGLSSKFTFELNTESIDKNVQPSGNQYLQYIQPGYTSIRGGGTAIILSKEEGNIITTGLRLSYGRILAETRPGYLFSELTNTLDINNKFKFNISPKIAFTGSGNLTSLGIGLKIATTPKLALIPEVNIGLDNSNTTHRITLRKKFKKNINIDTYLTNAIGSVDMSQMIKQRSHEIGLNIGIKI